MEQDKIIIELQKLSVEVKYLREEFHEHKEKFQPMLEIYKTSKNLGRFLLWTGGIITAVIGSLIALREFFK